MLLLCATGWLGIRECEARTGQELGEPDLQRFLLVILQGAFPCPHRLSFDKPLISLVNRVDVAVKMDEQTSGRRERQASVLPVRGRALLRHRAFFVVVGGVRCSLEQGWERSFRGRTERKGSC